MRIRAVIKRGWLEIAGKVGRLSRTSYWKKTMVLGFVFAMMLWVVFSGNLPESSYGGAISAVFMLCASLLALNWSASAAKRLHDADCYSRSVRFFLFIYFAGLATFGLVWLLSSESILALGYLMALGPFWLSLLPAIFLWISVLALKPSTPSSNKYGPNPQEVTS